MSSETESVIVADSSPLIGLARIGQLDLLRRSGRKILVPPAVWDEVTLQGRGAPGATEVRQAAAWLEIQAPDSASVAPLRLVVDRGEAEAIALAQGVESSLLLIDDAKARRVAQQLGLRLVGTVGLLRRAKKAGWISELRPQLEALQRNGIYIRQKLIDAVLQDVGE
jgi:predicted nucleic acid-binding protein